MNFKKLYLYSDKWLNLIRIIALRAVDAITLILSVAFISTLIYRYAVIDHPDLWSLWIDKLYYQARLWFFLSAVIHFWGDKHTGFQWKRFNRMALVIVLTFIAYLSSKYSIVGASINNFFGIFLLYDVTGTLILLSLAVMDLFRYVAMLMGRKTNPALVMTVSFIIIICIGAMLLMMPRSTVSGISWVDSFFLSTSAVCVTGLSTVDVPTTFTSAGLVILLALMQIGGMGVLTITNFFLMSFVSNVSVRYQMLVRDMLSSQSLNSLLKIMLGILAFTLTIEGVGAAFLFIDIHGTLGLDLEHEIFVSIFHSVSAFCNAGFSTLPGGLGYEPLLLQHPMFYWTISILIILGGIGFPMLVNMKNILTHHILHTWQRLHGYTYTDFKYELNLNTRIVLVSTFVLLVSGTLFLAYFEWNHAFAGLSTYNKWTQSFFNAVCPRTAGFSSIDLVHFSVPSLLIYALLMWIGGAAFSTAGGIKVNVFYAAMLNVFSVLKGKNHTEAFRRELSHQSVRTANATISVSIIMIFVSIMVLVCLEPELSPRALAFECVSALGTVGTSLGITGLFSDPSKIFICMLMLIGRVGVLSFFMSFMSVRETKKYHYPQGDIVVS